MISGGQTGVDRAALDVALKRGIQTGGWCPAGRLDEFGRIPDRYPLREMESASFTDRTWQNVKDSDGTIIIYAGTLSGGTEQTVRFCVQQHRPHVLSDASNTLPDEAAKSIVDFVRKNKIETLNVAGPRQSEWPDGYEYATHVLNTFAEILLPSSLGD